MRHFRHNTALISKPSGALLAEPLGKSSAFRPCKLNVTTSVETGEGSKENKNAVVSLTFHGLPRLQSNMEEKEAACHSTPGCRAG